jgi:hypothetical protein
MEVDVSPRSFRVVGTVIFTTLAIGFPIAFRAHLERGMDRQVGKRGGDLHRDHCRLLHHGDF